MKRKKLKLNGERWENNISDNEQHLQLLPRVCEAILYMPHLTSFFVKLHQKYAIVNNDNKLKSFNYKIEDFLYYGTYSYNDIQTVLHTLIEAETNEDLRVEIYKKLSIRDIYYEPTLVAIDNLTIIKSVLDGYIRYYYNWLFFKLPTKQSNWNSDDEFDFRKSIIDEWEELIENNDNNLFRLEKNMKIEINNSNFLLDLDKALNEVIVKKQFDRLLLQDFFTCKIDEKIFNNSNVKLSNFPVLNNSLPNRSSSKIEIPDELKKNNNTYIIVKRCVEYQLYTFHIINRYQGVDILKLLQGNFIKKDDIRKAIESSALVVDKILSRGNKHNLVVFTWAAISNLITLMQKRENQKFISDYCKICTDSLNNNKQESKSKKSIEIKDSEILKLKKMLELKNKEVENDLVKYKKIIKEQDKELYSLRKKIEELEKKDEQIIEKKPEEILEDVEIDIEVEKNKEIRIFTKEEFREVIKNNKISIYGGAPKWQAKIKRKYPELNIIEASSTVSLSSLDNSFLLVYVNIWTSHAAWERVVSYVESLNIPECHLNNYNEKFLWETVIMEFERLDGKIKVN